MRPRTINEKTTAGHQRIQVNKVAGLLVSCWPRKPTRTMKRNITSVGTISNALKCRQRNSLPITGQASTFVDGESPAGRGGRSARRAQRSKPREGAEDRP